jgi:hypothetical protein
MSSLESRHYTLTVVKGLCKIVPSSNFQKRTRILKMNPVDVSTVSSSHESDVQEVEVNYGWPDVIKSFIHYGYYIKSKQVYTRLEQPVTYELLSVGNGNTI